MEDEQPTRRWKRNLAFICELLVTVLSAAEGDFSISSQKPFRSTHWHARAAQDNFSVVEDVISMTTDVSAAGCARACLHSHAARSFSFRQQNQSCLLLFRLPVHHSVTSPAPDTRTYQFYSKVCPVEHGYSLLDENFCVKIFMESLTWQQAQDFCEREGGHLVFVRDLQQRDLLRAFLDAAPGRSSSYQVGLTDLKQEDDFHWLDGQTTRPELWDAGQPNGQTSQNCAVVSYSRGTKCAIHDRNCLDKYPFVCQLPLAPWQ